MKSQSTDRIVYFEKFAFYTEMLFKVMLTLYILSVFTFLPYPIFMYLFRKEVVTMLGLYMPGIDETTLVGYTFLTIYQFIALLFATLGVCAYDFFIAISTISSLIFSKIISLEMDQINIDLEKGESILIVLGRFRNVILMHQEMLK